MKKYIHYKNKKEYELVDTCKIQENGIWIIGVIYKQVGTNGSDSDSGNMLFCRSMAEFNCKFEEIEDE